MIERYEIRDASAVSRQATAECWEKITCQKNVRVTQEDLRELPYELAIPDNARLKKRHAMPPAIDKDRKRPSRMNEHLKRPLHVPATLFILHIDLHIDLDLHPSTPRGTSHATLGHDTPHHSTYKTQGPHSTPSIGKTFEKSKPGLEDLLSNYLRQANTRLHPKRTRLPRIP